METANIAEFKKHLSSYLSLVEKGETIEICRRNLPIARVLPVRRGRKNGTLLGCGTDSVVFHGSLTDPLIPEEDWVMLKEDESD